MEHDSDCIAALRTLEQRARERPCTSAGLRQLQEEMESQLADYRRRREVRRADGAIAAESSTLRMAIHSARLAIRNSLGAHAQAQEEVNRLAALLRRGHVQEAAFLRLQDSAGREFSDLNLNFVDEAVTRQQAREQRLLVTVLTLTAVLLGIACLVEMWRRYFAK